MKFYCNKINFHSNFGKIPNTLLVFNGSYFFKALPVIPNSYFKNLGWNSLLQQGICSTTGLVSRSLNIEGASNGIAEEREQGVEEPLFSEFVLATTVSSPFFAVQLFYCCIKSGSTRATKCIRPTDLLRFDICAWETVSAILCTTNFKLRNRDRVFLGVYISVDESRPRTCVCVWVSRHRKRAKFSMKRSANWFGEIFWLWRRKKSQFVSGRKKSKSASERKKKQHRVNICWSRT